MTDRAADLDVLGRVTANHDVLARLRDRSSPRTPASSSPWDLDGFVLHSHPDLTERLDEVGAGLPGGGRCVGVYGYAALVDEGGVIRVVAMGNAGLAIRVADPETRADIARSSRFTWSDFGDGWVGADAWPVDLPLEVGTGRVRAWLRAAYLVSEPEVAG